VQVGGASGGGDAAAAAAPTPPASGGGAFWRFYERPPDNKKIWGLLQDESAVPIRLRLAYSNVGICESREELLASVYDALRFSDLWKMMLEFSAYGSRCNERKQISYFGALPARGADVPRSGSRLNYVDPGNRVYSHIYDLIAHTGNELMKLTPRLQIIYSAELKGDVLEAVLGSFAAVEDRYQMDKAWENEPWRLTHQNPLQNTAIRLMLVAAFYMDIARSCHPTFA
jgi:hypothetical protein